MSSGKIAIIVVVCVVFLAGVIGGTWYGSKAYYNRQKPPIVVTHETPTTTTVIQTPSTPEEWLKWKDAKVEITGKMNADNTFYVKATDGYKLGEKTFTLKCKQPPETMNIIILNYVGIWGFGHDDLSYSHGAQIQYYRMIIPMVGVGFGVLATQRELGVTAGLLIKF